MKKRPNKLPPGLHAALSQNPAALQAFSSLPKDIRQSVINSSVSVSTPEGMEALVSRLATPPLS